MGLCRGRRECSGGKDRMPELADRGGFEEGQDLEEEEDMLCEVET